MINYNSINSLISSIKKEGIHLTKSRGQNFLIDRNIREFIADYLDIEKSDIVWEIGGGFGSISSLLIKKSENFSIFELDKGFLSVLRREFPNAKLIEGDFLKTYQSEWSKNKPKFIFGNLPYNVSAKIIISLAISDMFPDSMIFMIQKELYQRMTSKVGGKNYSSFSVLSQALTKTEMIKEVSAESFFPRPKVESVVIEIKRNKDLKRDFDLKLFEKILHTTFLSRRKTIINNFQNDKYFSNLNMKEKLLKINIDPNLRAQRLTYKDFISLCKLLQNPQDSYQNL